MKQKRTYSKDSKTNMGSKTKELWKDPEYRKRMSDAHKGKIHSGSFKKGHKLRNTGRTRFKKGENLGENHFQWKADNVGYISLHSWIRRHYGKANKCENPTCKYPRLDASGKMMIKPKAYHWANKTGKYWRVSMRWYSIFDNLKQRSDGGNNSKFWEVP